MASVTSSTSAPLTSTLTDENKKRLDALDKDTKANELKSKQQMGKEQFLNLITKQLSNQDPLAPQENTEFISQMAQLQSLETNNSLLTYAKNTYTSTTEMAKTLAAMNTNIKALVDKMTASTPTPTTPTTPNTSNTDTLSADAVSIINELNKINKAMETYFNK